MRRYSGLLCFACGFLAIVLFGCGGGGNSNVTTSSSKGDIAFLIHWPTPTRLIPASTSAITITLTANHQKIAERTIPSPGKQQDVTATFTGLPAGTIQADAVALPPADYIHPGTAPLATVSLVLTVTPAKTTQVALSLNSNIHTLFTLGDTTFKAIIGQRYILGVEPQDANGNWVFTPYTNWKWTNDAPNVASLTPAGPNGDMTALALGTAHFTVTETESGLSKQFTLQVTPLGGVIVDIGPKNFTMARNTLAIIRARVVIPPSVSDQLIWSVQEGPAGGYARARYVYGAYFAPNTPGTYHIVATSVADRSVSATATVNVVVPTRRYAIQDLGPVDSYLFTQTSLALNDSGQATGAFTRGDNTLGAFRMMPGVQIGDPGTDLGNFAAGTTSMGTGINASGQVAGIADIGMQGNGGLLTHAFRSTPNGVAPPVLTDLGVLQGDAFSIATGINAGGQVIGMSYSTNTLDLTGPHHAFRTTPNGLAGDPGADLGGVSGARDTDANDINASGQVVGSVIYGPSDSVAYRTTATGKVDSNALIGTLNSKANEIASVGLGINDSGQVTGYGYMFGDYLAYRTIPNGRLEDGTAALLGSLMDPNYLAPQYFTLKCIGRKINNHGDVVGYAQMDPNGTKHAFVYVDHLMDLNELIPTNSGWVLQDATGINNAGQITGYGTFNGQKHAFLLTLVSP